MKNIQVIDAADNCTYSIFAASDDDFASIFPGGTDIEFSEDLFQRLGEDLAIEITNRLWKRRSDKKATTGIHGTLYYQLLGKKVFYPTKKEAEMVPLGVASGEQSRRTVEAPDRQTAVKLNATLRAACQHLNEAAALVPGRSTEGIRRRIAETMTTIGWDILESSVYSAYPDLRPYQLDRPAD